MQKLDLSCNESNPTSIDSRGTFFDLKILGPCNTRPLQEADIKFQTGKWLLRSIAVKINFNFTSKLKQMQKHRTIVSDRNKATGPWIKCK